MIQCQIGVLANNLNNAQDISSDTFPFEDHHLSLLADFAQEFHISIRLDPVHAFLIILTAFELRYLRTPTNTHTKCTQVQHPMLNF